MNDGSGGCEGGGSDVRNNTGGGEGASKDGGIGMAFAALRFCGVESDHFAGNAQEVSMLQTREIPSDQWTPFFNDFNRRHVGEPVTVELLGVEYGAQPESQNLPLIGIVCDEKETDRYRIEVSAGDAPDTLITHEVDSPTKVMLAETEDGVEKGARDLFGARTDDAG